MTMTTTDQDRRIEDRSIELGAARVEIAPLGPASSRDVAARYRDKDGRELDVERIRADGSTGDARPWATRARLRWLRYAGAGAGAGALALVAALVLAVAPAAAAAPRSTVVALDVLEETVPCKHGGRVVSIREAATRLRLVRRPRPPLYLRRASRMEELDRRWELDRRDPEDRGLVRYIAHWPRAELLNVTPVEIRVRVRCDRAGTNHDEGI